MMDRLSNMLKVLDGGLRAKSENPYFFPCVIGVTSLVGLSCLYSTHNKICNMRSFGDQLSYCTKNGMFVSSRKERLSNKYDNSRVVYTVGTIGTIALEFFKLSSPYAPALLCLGTNAYVMYNLSCK